MPVTSRYPPSRSAAGAVSAAVASLLALASAPAVATDLSLDVELHADEGRIEVTQVIRETAPRKVFEFALNEALAIEAATANGEAATLTSLGAGRWRAGVESGARALRLRYGGRPSLGEHPLGNYLAADGAWLSASGGWYARPLGRLASTELRVRNDAGWACLSQGRELSARGAATQHWREPNPQRDLHLVCADFHRYFHDSDGDRRVTLQAWLRSPDEALATRYLEAAARQLALYEPLLGAYPYAKFALVENRAQTGFGMPSFTLLGDRVIRLPFIVNSSFPHELVHNWLGNGVYVDAAMGNWSEGLTTYLSDHALAERRGEGRAHRRKALMRIAVQAEQHEGYPITAFRARASVLDSAIGYDRVMMLIHRTRRALGDATFRNGVRHFVSERLFQPTRFDELGSLLAADDPARASALTAMLDPWLRRTDLPMLALGRVERRTGHVDGVIRQAQSGAPFDLTVEIVATLTDGEIVRETVRFDDERELRFSLPVGGEVARLDVDPGAHALRHLPISDRPRHLAETLEASPVAVIHPRTASDDAARYRAAAAALGLADVRVADAPPDGEASVLLGAAFATRPEVRAALTALGAPAEAPSPSCRALAARLVGESGERAASPAVWLDCDAGSAATVSDPLPGLARVLRRYGNRGLVVASDGARARATDAPWPDGTLSVVWREGTPMPGDDTPPLLGR